jgi:CHAT domain-containing protein
MDEQRHQAYLELTQELLGCNPDLASVILKARREWVDDGWVEMLEQAAEYIAKQGNSEGAEKIYALRDSAAQLVALESVKMALPFWKEVWSKILESQCEPQAIASLLRANLNRLNDRLAETIQYWAASAFPLVVPESRFTLAGLLVNFSNQMLEFPLGSRASNLEIAIAGYEVGLEVLTEDPFPEEWAIVQNSLAVAYNNRIRGERTENLEQAISCYQNALRFYTKDAFSQQWAMLQNNLGTAYSARILGDRSANLEQAIICHQNALKIYTYNAFPVGWAMIQHNLGVAYRSRIEGEQADNLDRAIAYFRLSLRVRTRSDFAEEWADTQKNLGIVYSERQRGTRSKNLERAINYLQNALQIFTRTDFPGKWAETQKNLGVSYWQRLEGQRAENLEKAIACYQNALQVYNQTEFPETWAETQNALAVAYRNNTLGERKQNLEKAIDCCQAALQVRTPDAFPYFHAETQLNLGLIYQENQQLEFAYSAFAAAIDIVESLWSEIFSGGVAKRKLAEEWHLLYLNIVEVCLELAVAEPYYIAKAIAYVERSKTKTLVELILSRDLNRIFPPEVASELQQIQDEIIQRQNCIQFGGAANSIELAQSLQKLWQQRRQIQNRYLAVGSGFDLSSFCKNLDCHTSIIEWFVADGKFLTFILTPKDPSLAPDSREIASSNFLSFEENQWRLSVCQSTTEDWQSLTTWLEGYLRDYYEDKNRWHEQLMLRLGQLSKILHLERIIEQLPKSCDRLVLIPHRYLHFLPLHALPLSSNSPIDLFNGGVRYAPSCQLLQLAQTRQRPDLTDFLAIQNPTEDLAYAELEVRGIRDKFDVSFVFQKTEATKSVISNNNLKNIHCIHFACHGFFDLVSPSRSGLQLADGLLTLEEIFSLDLPHTRLVTLSACETGLSDLDSISDEYTGLPSGFLYAGTPSVVSSLWEVNDISTTFLITKFYENWKQGLSVAVALNLAQSWLRDATGDELQQWMEEQQLLLNPTLNMSLQRRFRQNRQPFQSPFYWAAFCAVGQ